MAAPTEKACLHEAFGGSLNVNRRVDKQQIPYEYVLDVEVWCDQCGLRFSFVPDPVYSKTKVAMKHELKPSYEYIKTVFSRDS